MPIPSPILDDRSYQQLRDELVRRIPVYAPEWTDHNPSDPGITLIELFAFLGENLLYRFNQIPELTKLAFLRLLQVPLRSATPATAIVTMTTEASGGVLVASGVEAKAGDLSYETLNETKVWPLSARAVCRTPTAEPDPDLEPEVSDFVARTRDALKEKRDNRNPIYYKSDVLSPDGSGPVVDFDASIGGILWVAVLREKGADLEKLAGGILNLGFVPDPLVDPTAVPDPCPGAGPAARGPAVEWQVSAGTDAKGNPVYTPIQVLGDTTRGLKQEGIVRLQLPRQKDKIAGFDIDDPDLLGTDELPPILDDETAENVLFWLRAFRPDGSRFGKVLLVTINAAQVRQTVAARPEFVGIGSGQPNQRYRLVHQNVLTDTVVVEVEETGGWRSWKAVDSFDASGPEERHYLVDSEAGTVLFGNGIRGWPPQIGERIRALGYRYGGGARGNVAPKAISKLVGAPGVKTVENPLRAHGGGDAEPIAVGLDRIPGELRRRDRAVTATDFHELALQTPGANVGRAECLPRFHWPSKQPERAGVVSVVVWPQEDPTHPNAPQPDRELLRSVCAWLDQRRLVTTELYVVPPIYRRVAVAIGTKVKDGYDIEAVRRWVELAVRQYLAPLPPHGPSGGGWPLGRRVHGPELEAAALQVEGVEYLEDVNVAGWDAQAGAWVPGSVILQPYEVPELAVITVVEGPPLPVGQDIIPEPTDTVAVPIPVLREEC